MSDTVKSVFKILIKVPIIIGVVFLVFDVFAFVTSYFRLLSVSYTIQNVVIENNYIPDSEANSINDYLDGLETTMLRDVRIVNGEVGEEARIRHQYGQEITTGVTGQFIWAVPFLPMENTAHTGALTDSTTGPNTYTIYDHTADGDDPVANGVTQTITISFTVPGMAYYPDLTY